MRHKSVPRRSLLRSRKNCVAAVLSVWLSAAGAPAATVTVGGPFELVAADGAVVTDETFRGKWLLVFFGYTSCPDTCPTALYQISVALDALGAEAAMIQPLFITVDPARDTPEVVGAYAGGIDRRIIGLSGTAAQVAAVANEYGAYNEAHKSRPDDRDYLVDHSTYVYLMGPDGGFVGGLDAGAPGEEMAGRIETLMAGGK